VRSGLEPVQYDEGGLGGRDAARYRDPLPQARNHQLRSRIAAHLCRIRLLCQGPRISALLHGLQRRASNNVIVERFLRTIKYEKLHLEMPETVAEAFRMCAEFIAYCNQARSLLIRQATTNERLQAGRMKQTNKFE
jgi:hypothetical protein